MAPKTPKLGDDVAFGITSGYYPQIASRIQYKERPGIHGSTGAKYARVKGFSSGSIAKAEKYTYGAEGESPVDEKGKYTDLKTAWQKTLMRRKLYKSEEDLPAGERLLKRQDFLNKKTGRMQEHYRWVGGSDEFRIFGDQIWYMHGIRSKGSNVLLDYVKGFGQEQPAFQNIYSKSEGKLIDRATKMADRVFGRALDKVAIKRFGEAVGEAASAEEIGFKAGDFEYLPLKQALKATDNEGNLKYAHLLDSVAKGSYANERDMVKIIHTEAGPVVERIYDVTEMPIGEGPGVAGHGIVDIPPALTEAIDAAINMNDPKGDMESLRKAVQQMFIKNIKDDYNPLIQEMKEKANVLRKDAGKGKATTFENIISELKKDKSGRVAKSAIQSGLGIKLGAAARNEATPDVYSETAMSYVVHMLATWGAKVGNDYTQAHRVFDFDDSSAAPGQSVFAYTKMRQYRRGGRIMEFVENAPKGKKNTFLVTGYNATLALEVSRGNITEKQAQVKSLGNKRTLMNQRVTNYGRGAIERGKSGITQGNKPQWSTQVFTAPNKSMNVMLQRMLDAVIGKEKGAYAEELRGIMASELAASVYSLGTPKSRVLKRGGDFNKPMFWALPYIGVLQSEHIERDVKK
jgi:hypothetical protein